MIKEAYCSFEISKLLKEKGFNENVRAWYNIYDKVNIDFRVSPDAPHLQIPCPTHQMTMAWLREVHNIHIEIRININNSLYSFRIYSVGISGARAFTEYRIKSFEVVEGSTWFIHYNLS